MTDTKYCEDCAFYQPGSEPRFAKCGNPKSLSPDQRAEALVHRNPVAPEAYYCTTMRTDTAGNCGTAGEWFEQKAVQ